MNEGKPAFALRLREPKVLQVRALSRASTAAARRPHEGIGTLSMLLRDLITPADSVVGLRAAGKTQVLSELAARLALRSGVPAERIAEAFAAREELGSTGIGRGIALPHARIAGARLPCAVVARIARPVEFAAVDGKPVDLLCAIVAPDHARSEALAALAAVSRALRDSSTVESLRKAPDARALHEALLAADAAATAG